MDTATVFPSCATWLPADDILLKNAVEEGASLEALAKGAVHFSHPFSLQEVKDRWHALLYNPDISAKACAHFLIDESDKPKEISTSHRKRKGGTIRNLYFSKLKRIQKDFYSSANLAFLTEYNLNSCATNGGDCHVQGTLHNRTQVDPKFDILQQDFPQVLTDLAATNGVSNGGDTLYPEGLEPLVNNQISETANNNLPFSVQGSVRIDGMPQFQLNNNECNDIIPHNLQANSTVTGKILLPSGELSNTNPYTMGCSPLLPDTDDSKSKRVDEQSGGSFINGTFISVGDFVDLPEPFDFLKDDMLFMDVDGIDLVHNSCFDNTLSVLPMNMDDVDTYKVEEEAMMVVNAAFATVLGEEKHVPHVKVEKSSTSALNNKPLEHSEGKLYCVLNTEDSNVPCNDDIFLLIHPDAACVSSAMISITESAMDRVSVIERNSVQGLNSVKKSEELTLSLMPSLLSITKSAMDRVSVIERNDVQGLNSVKKSEELALSPVPSLISSTKRAMDRVSVIERNGVQGLNSVKKSEELALSPMPSLISNTKSVMDRVSVIERNSVQGLNSVKKSEEFTESPMPSLISISKTAMDPVSVKESTTIQGHLVKETEELTQSSKPSLMLGSYLLPKMDQVPTSGGTTVRVSSNDICKNLVPEHNTVDHPTQCKPSQTSLACVLEANLDNDFKKVDSGAVDTPVILKELLLHTESGPAEITDPESVVNPSTSDHEGPESEIDDPHFSDIEAMILDMDLGSYDDDLYFKRRVSRYQQENSKRAIIRLEQCARASIERALTSRGALAVLYGRRSRHFIRKKEVILGRSTQERTVDIDLGSEGRHNKISRYQAIVRMKDDGSFSLKNLAKNPILVNGAEVGTGELIGLGSSSLIEIRGISFVFEPNRKYVNRYLKNTEKEKQEQMAKFEWLPMEDGAMS